MKFEGDITDLVKFKARPVKEFWVIKLNHIIYSFDKREKDAFYTKEGYAKASLRNHIYANFCQGHYWHKGLNNTFEKEGGLQRNNGNVDKSREEFYTMANEMTEQLLKDKIFTIEKIIL